MTLKLLDVATIYPSLRLIPALLTCKFNSSACYFITDSDSDILSSLIL